MVSLAPNASHQRLTLSAVPLHLVAARPAGQTLCLAILACMPLLVGGCGSSSPKDEMVSIPAGTYTIGREVEEFPQEGPVHQVTLGAYEIDIYEVTNAQFRAFTNAEDCPGPLVAGNPDPCVYDGAVQSNTRPNYWTSGEFQNYPVLNVRWDQAEAYCRWRGKRLPTEAEWEVAARGSEAYLYPWGDSEPTCDEANYEGCTPDTVGRLAIDGGESPFGALYMAGNLAEWTADWYNADYYTWGPTDNPIGPQAGSSKVVRGGSWYCPATKVTTTYRDHANPMWQYNTIGFRCVRAVTE